MIDILRKKEMAKYTRFDPRNRKYGRNKDRSLKKDFRIREAEDNKANKYYGKKIEWVNVDETEDQST
mgnify:FL=1|jgi:hypothetical protein